MLHDSVEDAGGQAAARGNRARFARARGRDRRRLLGHSGSLSDSAAGASARPLRRPSARRPTTMAYFASCSPDKVHNSRSIVRGLSRRGGGAVAAVHEQERGGPTVVLRGAAELLLRAPSRPLVEDLQRAVEELADLLAAEASAAAALPASESRADVFVRPPPPAARHATGPTLGYSEPLDVAEMARLPPGLSALNSAASSARLRRGAAFLPADAPARAARRCAWHRPLGRRHLLSVGLRSIGSFTTSFTAPTAAPRPVSLGVPAGRELRAGCRVRPARLRTSPHRTFREDSSVELPSLARTGPVSSQERRG